MFMFFVALNIFPGVFFTPSPAELKSDRKSSHHHFLADLKEKRKERDFDRRARRRSHRPEIEKIDFSSVGKTISTSWNKKKKGEGKKRIEANGGDKSR